MYIYVDGEMREVNARVLVKGLEHQYAMFGTVCERKLRLNVGKS